MESRMHKFYLNNKYIVLDVNSGSVHVVDKIVYDILDHYKEKPIEDILTIYKDIYDEVEVSVVHSELSVLEEQGLLYSEPTDLSKLSYNENNVVKAMCLHIAHDCNMKCSYCFASQGNFKGERSMMSLEVGKKSLDFLIKNSGNRHNLEVDFFGGEPLMNFQVVKDLVAYGRELEVRNNKHFRFTITTNGILLDEDKIEFINENMDNVVLSLDGRKEVNDNMRKTMNNEGTYDIILPKFKAMVEKRGDKDYYIRGTFTSKNIDFSNDARDFYNQGFKMISIEPVVTSEEMDYAIREEHLESILAEYEKFSNEYIDIKRKDEDFYFFHFMIDLTQGPCIIKRAVGCGAGSEYLAVTPEGDLYPCHQFVGEEEFKMGNVYTGMENNILRDKFKNANVNNKEECKSCWARFYCSGGCHANAHYAHNDIMKPYEIGCKMEKKRIECAISVVANLEY